MDNNQIPLYELMPDDETSKKILNERRRLLAKNISHYKTDTNKDNCVVFRLENEHYGINYADIDEVYSNISLTQVPFAPNYIAGITNIRGKIITLIDLYYFFYNKKTVLGNDVYAILIRKENTILAILTKNIVGNSAYVQSELLPPLENYSEIAKTFISGLDKGAIAILNVEAIVNYILKNTDNSE